MLHSQLSGKKEERGGRSRGVAFASPAVARRATSVVPLSSESGKTRSHAGTLHSYAVDTQPATKCNPSHDTPICPRPRSQNT